MTSHCIHLHPGAFIPCCGATVCFHLHSFSQTDFLFCKPSPVSQHWIYTFPYVFGLQGPMDGWKLMSSPSPGIQSEQGNYAAIWSSSALQSQQIVPPSAAPACLTQLLSSNVMTTKTSCTDCLHCPAPARPLQSGSEWQAHEFLQQCHLT